VRRLRAAAALAVLTVAVAVGAFITSRPPKTAANTAPSAPEPELVSPEEEDERSLTFRMPTGEPAAIDCRTAQTIVKQVRSALAYPPPPIDPNELASATSDWLDPHGMWSAADDSPIEPLLASRARDLAREVEGTGACASATEIARTLAAWVSELRTIFDGAGAGTESAADAIRAATSTGSARAIAKSIGERTRAAASL